MHGKMKEEKKECGVSYIARNLNAIRARIVTMQNCFQLIEFHFVMSIRVENIEMENSVMPYQ